MAEPGQEPNLWLLSPGLLYPLRPLMTKQIEAPHRAQRAKGCKSTNEQGVYFAEYRFPDPVPTAPSSTGCLFPGVSQDGLSGGGLPPPVHFQSLECQHE